MSKIESSGSVRDLLHENQFRVKKHLGQNFLKDRNILEKIIKAANITENTGVIEVGPGLGSLTEYLLKVSPKVLAYEIDEELIPILNARFKEYDHFSLLANDILKVNIDDDIDKFFPNRDDIVVVANLPYYITTPILMRFLETSKKVKRLILMMQHEVAMRVTSKPDTKDYNALTVVINYRSTTQYLFKVPKTVFVPEPNVDSAVVSIDINSDIVNRPVDEPFFFDMVHRCFTQRRKTLLNNLRDFYSNYDREFWLGLITELGFSPTVRAEALSIDDFIALSNRISKLKEK